MSDSGTAEPIRTPPRLVLASASPRRQALLREAGYEFEVRPAVVDEESYPAGLAPSDVARWLALCKAQAVASLVPQSVVLGADTLVTFGDQILGKPADASAARAMLQLLAGTTHIVITALSVVHRARGFESSTRIMSAVHMRPLTPLEIDQYVESNQWQGKAGGYGIQDHDPFVIRQAGSHSNIVGLPLRAVGELLSSAGIPVPPGGPVDRPDL
jgi:septum formation protein